MAESPLLRLQGLSAAAAPGLARAAIRGLSFALQAGEQVAVIGASGSGKTSLLSTLALAQPPLAGRLEILGQDPWALGRAPRHRLRAALCLAPQTPPLPPRQRVVTAVLAGRLPEQSLWQSLRTLWSPPEAPLAHAALQTLDLGDKLWQRVDQLSGGERQRVGLARLLVSSARLWLVDEPLSALDPTRAEQALQSLQQAARERGRTLVCSLHQLGLARRLFPRILALKDGELVFDGPAEALDDALLQRLYGFADFDAVDAAPDVSAAAATASESLLPQAMCR
jgi:phosphonate transport system ATP-binding protein